MASSETAPKLDGGVAAMNDAAEFDPQHQQNQAALPPPPDYSQMSPEEARLAREIETLHERLDVARKAVQDTDFYKMTQAVVELGRVKLKIRRRLRGHLAKITQLHWSSDNQLLVTAAQDGKLIVWDSYTGCKVFMIPLGTAWVIGCAFSPSRRFVASGGLDNFISVFDLQSKAGPPQKPCLELTGAGGHKGYVSCCRFLGSGEGDAADAQLVSGSGDTSCILWDVQRQTPISRFFGHENDVTALELGGGGPHSFVSVSADHTCRRWDIRCAGSGQECVQIFRGHELDVNGLSFFPGPASSYGFFTSSDDGSCRLWDIRADQSIAVYMDDFIVCGSTCVACSQSGRLLLAGYDDFNCHVWDVLREERVGIMSAHEGRVSALGVSGDGLAVASTSWDSTGLIWTGRGK